jgi:hypothetical protein
MVGNLEAIGAGPVPLVVNAELAELWEAIREVNERIDDLPGDFEFGELKNEVERLDTEVGCL